MDDRDIFGKCFCWSMCAGISRRIPNRKVETVEGGILPYFLCWILCGGNTLFEDLVIKSVIGLLFNEYLGL